jgi:hypothetical protein
MTSPLVKTALGVLFGAALGFGWYRTVGCASGTCAITSRWWTSTLYGAFMGWLATTN